MLGPGAYVATSRDSDRASRMINRAMITGFMSVGVNVEDLREMPIPVVRHAVNHGREAGGIHVRRSPFDPRVVDILFFDADGRDLPPAKTQSIERLFSREDFPRSGPDGTGVINFPTRVVEGYREHFLSEVDRERIAERGFTLVVDFAYGTTVEVFPDLLGSLGRLGGIVRASDAALGLWTDPRREVIRLVGDAGRPLSPELAQAVFVALAPDYLAVEKVAIPVASPAIVARTIRARGAELRWTKTEHHAMMASATDVDMVAGVRGEFIFPHFIPAYDAMFASVKLLEALARSGLRLRDCTDRCPPIHVVHARVACPWARKGAVMRRLIEETEGEERQLVDGVKVWFGEDAWVLVIPHSHKPYFVLTAEGPTREEATELVAVYTAKLERWRDAAVPA